jgi:hypothetical protein
MAKGRVFAFSNVLSPDKEREFNSSYDGQPKNLAGVTGMKRFCDVAQANPTAEKPAFAHVAVFDLDDIDTAVQSVRTAATAMTMSDCAIPRQAQLVALLDHGAAVFRTDRQELMPSCQDTD